MASYTSNAPVQWVPELLAAYVDTAKENASIAYQVGTTMTIAESKVKIPLLTSDPVSTFGAEGSDLNESDPGLGGLTVEPVRVGVVSKVSREFFDDQTQIASAITSGQGRDIARRIDRALFSEPAASADDPDGLHAIAAQTTEVKAGAAWANVDPFDEAVGNADSHGTTVTNWVCNADTAHALGVLKVQTGSNLPLLGSDPTQPGRRAILGAPLLVSDWVSDGVVWGIPAEHLVIVQRGGIESAVDESVYFKSFGIALRSVQRVGFAVTLPAAVQRVAVDDALLISGS